MEEELEDEEIDRTQEQIENSLSVARPWLWRKGQSGNPGGRPKGTKSMKQWAKEMLASMTDDERQEFMKGLSKDIIWKMAEGNPETKTDITTAGESLNKITNKDLLLAREIDKLEETNESDTGDDKQSEGSNAKPMGEEV